LIRLDMCPSKGGNSRWWTGEYQWYASLLDKKSEASTSLITSSQESDNRMLM